MLAHKKKKAKKKHILASGQLSTDNNSTMGDGPINTTFIFDPNYIRGLIHDVRALSSALLCFKEAIISECFKEITYIRLDDLLRGLKCVINKHQALNSVDLQNAAQMLTEKVKAVNFTEVNEENKNDLFGEVFSSVEKLALTLGNNLTNLLMGDITNGSMIQQTISQESKTFENISMESMDSHIEKGNFSPLELENILLKNTDSVELALTYAKTWSKYTKNIISWVEKKLNLEFESMRNLVKLAETTRSSIELQEFMPLRVLFTNALLNDVENSQHLQRAIESLQTNKFVQPLLGRKNEMEKQRKTFKELWKQEQHKMLESETALKKAKLLCMQRQEEYEKAKSSMFRAEEEHLYSSGGGLKSINKQLEKKRRLEEEALQKVEEANDLYKVCMTSVEDRRNDLENTKREILTQLQKIIYQCDLTLKAVTVNFFQIQQQQAASLASQMESFFCNAKQYDPGKEYNDFIVTTNSAEEKTFIRNVNKQLTDSSCTSGYQPSNSLEGVMHLPDTSKVEDDSCTDATGTSFIRSWTLGIVSDSESTGGSSESRSLDSESISPGDFHRKLPRTPSSGTMSSAEDLDDREIPSPSEAGPNSLGLFKKTLMSKAALTHKFRKLRSPSKCRDCEGIVVFQGLECEECLLGCHKKCLENLVIICGHQKLLGKIHLFGAEFTSFAKKEPDGIPFVLKLCVSEIENKALCLQGIYRISGNKARMDKLCQALENGHHYVDLSEFSSHDISDVLKFYLRQLPEPFILFRLYNEFIALAKEIQLFNEDQETKKDDTEEKKKAHNCVEINRILVKSKDLLRQLPVLNFNSFHFLILHLKRVVDHSDKNKMDSKNLGLIFGPTLIRPRPSTAPITYSTIAEFSKQAQLIEFIITYSKKIFDGILQSQDVRYTDTGYNPKQLLPPDSRDSEKSMNSLYLSTKEDIQTTDSEGRFSDSLTSFQNSEVQNTFGKCDTCHTDKKMNLPADQERESVPAKMEIICKTSEESPLKFDSSRDSVGRRTPRSTNRPILLELSQMPLWAASTGVELYIANDQVQDTGKYINATNSEEKTFFGTIIKHAIKSPETSGYQPTASLPTTISLHFAQLPDNPTLLSVGMVRKTSMPKTTVSCHFSKLSLPRDYEFTGIQEPAYEKDIDYVCGNQVIATKQYFSSEHGRIFINFAKFSAYDVYNMLKSYISQMPEPLTLFKLCNEFITLATKIQNVSAEETQVDTIDDKICSRKYGEFNQIVLKTMDFPTKFQSFNFCNFKLLIDQLQWFVGDYCKINLKSTEVVFGQISVQEQSSTKTLTIASATPCLNEGWLTEFNTTYTKNIPDKSPKLQEVFSILDYELAVQTAYQPKALPAPEHAYSALDSSKKINFELSQTEHHPTVSIGKQNQVTLDNCTSYDQGQDYEEILNLSTSDKQQYDENVNNQLTNSPQFSECQPQDNLSQSKQNNTVDIESSKTLENESYKITAEEQDFLVKMSTVSMSSAALTHNFCLLPFPKKCKACHSNVFHGVECSRCSLIFHWECLGTLCITCGHQKHNFKAQGKGAISNKTAREKPDATPSTRKTCSTSSKKKTSKSKSKTRSLSTKVNSHSSEDVLKTQIPYDYMEMLMDCLDLPELSTDETNNLFELYFEEVAIRLSQIEYQDDFFSGNWVDYDDYVLFDQDLRYGFAKPSTSGIKKTYRKKNKQLNNSSQSSICQLSDISALCKHDNTVDILESIKILESEKYPVTTEPAGFLGKMNKFSMSKAALTHTFHKLVIPKKCRACYSTVFRGVRCRKCSFACHWKCLDSLFVNCSHQKHNFKAQMMGVDFNKFARAEPDGVPSIMKILTSEIERNFLSTQGIYSIPGCPLNEKKICRALKRSMHFIDFSQFSEYDICDVLKLYLAKLPEPFISFQLYSKFSELALEIKREKERKHNKLYDSKGRPGKLISKQINLIILKMKEILRQLPPVNFNCFHYIIAHLKRVADRCHENEVSPDYIGLIFGPILFRTKVLKVSITNFPLLQYANEEILLEFILIYSDRIFDKALQPTKPLFTPEGDNFVDRKNTIFQQPMSVEKPENKKDTLEEYNKCPTEDIVDLSAEEQLDNASVKLINGYDSSLELNSPASDSSVEFISLASDSSREFISPANDFAPELILPSSDSSLELISSASDTKSNKGRNSHSKRSIKSFFSSLIGKFKKKKN